MRYPDGHKDTVRARLVELAASALRQHGFAGLSIPGLMKRAGMTHGGFYRHFAGRDELVADAVRAAAEQTAARVFDAAGDDVARVLEAYLSEGHVAHPEQGCVIAALGSDARAQPAAVRRAFADAAHGLLRLLERKLHPRGKPDALHDDTLRLAAQMVGAVVLARLVRDEALAERIVAAAQRTPTPR